jgi:cyanate permease
MQGNQEQDTPNPAAHGRPNRSLRWFQLAGVWALYASFGLSAASLAPLVPLLESDLRMSHAQMGLVLGAWQFVYIVAAIPCGVLLDRLGARWALVIGVSIIVSSMLARSLATDFWQMLGAVMLFGVGGPIVSSGAPKVVTRWFAGTERGFAMGIYATGPAIGGVIALTMTHSVFLPWLGGEWRDVLRLWSVVAVLGGLFWLAVASLPGAGEEKRGMASRPNVRHGAVVKELLADPAARLVLLMSIGVFFFNHGLNNWLPELLRASGMTLTTASLWAAIPTVVGIAGSLTIPRLATRQRRFTILLGLSLAAACASVLLQQMQDASLAAGLILQGIAGSSLMTILVLTLVELPGVGERHAGTASGLFFSFAEVGGVLGPVSLGLVYDLFGHLTYALGILTLVAITLSAGALRLGRLAHR